MKRSEIINNELNLQGTGKIQTETEGTETGKGTEIRMVGPSKNCLVRNKGKYKWRGGGTLDGTRCQEENHVCGRETKGQVTGQCKGY